MILFTFDINVFIIQRLKPITLSWRLHFNIFQRVTLLFLLLLFVGLHLLIRLLKLADFRCTTLPAQGFVHFFRRYISSCMLACLTMFQIDFWAWCLYFVWTQAFVSVDLILFLIKFLRSLVLFYRNWWNRLIKQAHLRVRYHEIRNLFRFWG